MVDLVARAFRGGYAVPAFCTWNAESMAIVLGVAERLRAPVILMQGPGEFPVLPPAAMAEVARAIEGRHHAAAALHLDHGDSIEMVRQCVEARYTSVMLDFSGRPFEENTAALREVVGLARPHGITVEGEIGKIGKADDASAEGGAASAYTDPADAVRYVKNTGVDLLAVSVGNKHGFYRGDPHLEFGLLAELHAAVPVPLVMHGGTGIPQKDIQRSIALGIAKVNVASELVHGYRGSLSAQWQKGENLWSPIAIGEAIRVMEPVVEKWIRITGAEGKA
jgi:fructose-bisphosphate aldolase class II/tagatose 1,6-diphosphate aldolase GatY/KbaY